MLLRLEHKVQVAAAALDIGVIDIEGAADAAVAVGGRRIGEVVYDEHGGFQVMADPEDNEFCFVNGPTAITA